MGEGDTVQYPKIGMVANHHLFSCLFILNIEIHKQNDLNNSFNK